MNSIKVGEYSRSRSFHDDLILQDQASGERSQDHWSSGLTAGNIRKTCPCNEYPLIPHFYVVKLRHAGVYLFLCPPTSEEVEGAYWFGSVRPVQSSPVVCSPVCDA